ncbi:MAG: hypothetical protein NVV70_06335 [Cellulomonas sp.]|nr:hypothetical protein [Cellulomonas sp.]MCR6647762.1 hypothetical protein [Cellulomonas sp.]
MEPIVEHADGSVSEFQPGFWDGLHGHVRGLPAAKRLVTWYGTRYGGAARSESSPAVDYVYIGRRRIPADFPDHAADDASDETPLDIPGTLVEPMYIRSIPGTNYAAFMRTSGGPSFAACESWLTQVLGYEGTGESIALRPYVRQDSIRRLAESDGVAKLELKFEPDSLRDLAEGDGEIAHALAAVDRLGGGGVSIEVGVSFGRSHPSDAGAERYAKDLQRILGKSGLTRAVATLLTRRPKPSKKPNAEPEYSFAREHVNFLRDQVVHSVRIKGDETVRRTPSLVLGAMGDAVQQFIRETQRGSSES